HLKELTQTDPQEGVSRLDVSEAAESLGFRTMGVRISFRQFKEEAVIPAIAHWNQDHFVVVYKFINNKVYVSDPAKGRVIYSEEDFCKSWIPPNQGEKKGGLALLMEPKK
ncbi:MAG: peptidase domain-containing ABC transporter, partial [bacterium]|nr:peptidase domain-containing ABC transporter [bacterium]